uniref:Uncharacterized protein n=2 Tax=Lotharella globosa TaxID=91324 RepID=A0A7S3YSE5_9EUKA
MFSWCCSGLWGGKHELGVYTYAKFNGSSIHSEWGRVRRKPYFREFKEIHLIDDGLGAACFVSCCQCCVSVTRQGQLTTLVPSMCNSFLSLPTAAQDQVQPVIAIAGDPDDASMPLMS